MDRSWRKKKKKLRHLEDHKSKLYRIIALYLYIYLKYKRSSRENTEINIKNI